MIGNVEIVNKSESLFFKQTNRFLFSSLTEFDTESTNLAALRCCEADLDLLAGR